MVGGHEVVVAQVGDKCGLALHHNPMTILLTGTLALWMIMKDDALVRLLHSADDVASCIISTISHNVNTDVGDGLSLNAFYAKRQ
jgi:hypothetical protein